MIFGALGFGACLLLIVGLLLATYPCANLTASSSEPFVCRDLSTVQDGVGMLIGLARISIVVLIFGLGLWLYRLGNKDESPNEPATENSTALAATLEIEAQKPKKHRAKKPAAKPPKNN